MKLLPNEYIHYFVSINVNLINQFNLITHFKCSHWNNMTVSTWISSSDHSTPVKVEKAVDYRVNQTKSNLSEISSEDTLLSKSINHGAIQSNLSLITKSVNMKTASVSQLSKAIADCKNANSLERILCHINIHDKLTKGIVSIMKLVVVIVVVCNQSFHGITASLGHFMKWLLFLGFS